MKIFKEGDRVYHIKLKKFGYFLEQDSINPEIGYAKFHIDDSGKLKKIEVKIEELIKSAPIYEPLHK